MNITAQSICGPLSSIPQPVTLNNNQLNQVFFNVTTAFASHVAAYTQQTAKNRNNNQLNQAFFNVATAFASRLAAYTQRIAKNLPSFVNTETNELRTRIDHIDQNICLDDHHVSTLPKSVEDDIQEQLDNMEEQFIKTVPINGQCHQSCKRCFNLVNSKFYVNSTRIDDLCKNINTQSHRIDESRHQSCKRRFDMVDSKLNVNSARIDNLCKTVHTQNNTQSESIDDIWKVILILEQDNIDLRQENIELRVQLGTLEKKHATSCSNFDMTFGDI
ncbi:hypothetical protein BDK51DRAFT_49818 [Blyttiomyces helicus]|uniref:Uncharacterized protein n=1 Tax=Blyttiomyces helicus TaxID=388810 RepID=A0A4P9VVE9_9FUNG|nr:hypothetical protein BDK51DRAFT_49818 [Blyttiomyces helicus]|eukprot:RKO83621.1 hypothetical protein BDK51DRAFT_49818 [Blyttiomyces helicus]